MTSRAALVRDLEQARGAIDRALAALAAAPAANAPGPSPAPRQRALDLASGAAKPVDLTGPYGDPVVYADRVRGWEGDSCKGKHYSECPPAFLRLLADALEHFAGVDEQEGKTTSKGTPVAPLKRRDAAKARAWADRLEPAAEGATRPQHRTTYVPPR